MTGVLIERWTALAEVAHYNAPELAALTRLSSRQLQRQFRLHVGRSPQDWLNEQRIVAARERLLSGDQVKKVAYDLGFKQSSHFCRVFKSLNNITPSEFVLLQIRQNAIYFQNVANR